MATKTPMDIGEIRFIERGLFWIERFLMVFQLFFQYIPWWFHLASNLFVWTNIFYLFLFAERLRIRPYPHDADELFYLERFALFCLACSYIPSAHFAYAWHIAVASIILSNVMYVIICLEPKQGENVQMNSNHASTTRGPNPKETDDVKELKKGKAEIDDEPPKEKLEDNQAQKEADGKCDEELLETSEDLNGHCTGSWEEVKIENVEHEVNHEKEGAQIEDNLEGEKVSCHEEEPKKAENVIDAKLKTENVEHEFNHEKERAQIEDNLEGEKVTCHEEEPKKAEDIIDAELLETDEISDASEESWEDVGKKDEEDATDQEHELQELNAECDDFKSETDRFREMLFEKKYFRISSVFLKNLHRDSKELHLKWEEQKELIAKITAAFGCSSDKIVEATERLQEMNHKLEEEKNDLSAKLEAATQSLEHYQCYQKYFEEERRKWNQEKEFFTVNLKACRRIIESIEGNANNPENQSNWAAERDDLTAKLTATNFGYQYYMRLCGDLYAKLSIASSSAESYQTCYNDAEERCRKLREENLDLSTKLCAETSSAIYFCNLMHEFEERCHKLEEDKTNLNSKLCTEHASAEFYRHCMRDLGA